MEATNQGLGFVLFNSHLLIKLPVRNTCTLRFFLSFSFIYKSYVITRHRSISLFFHLHTHTLVPYIYSTLVIHLSQTICTPPNSAHTHTHLPNLTHFLHTSPTNSLQHSLPLHSLIYLYIPYTVRTLPGSFT